MFVLWLAVALLVGVVLGVLLVGLLIAADDDRIP